MGLLFNLDKNSSEYSGSWLGGVRLFSGIMTEFWLVKTIFDPLTRYHTKMVIKRGYLSQMLLIKVE
jgi:hypothetical protein